MDNSLWSIRLEQLHFLDADEDGFLSDGDEPYLVAVGFRSRFRTPGSTQVFWGEMLDEKWGEGAEASNTKAIPEAMGVLAFPNVNQPTLADLAVGTMPEVLGALVMAMESDATPFGAVRDKVHEVQSVIRDRIVDLVERGNINLQDPTPAIRQAVQAAREALEPSLIEAIGLWLSSFTDPDDLVGIQVLAFGAVDPSVGAGVSLPLLSEGSITLDFPGDGVHYQVSGRVVKTAWHHGVPSAGDVPVAPGTSPTSWYTTPENVQHIAYVGTDQQIHECFFFIG